jgi:hypothetical protein
MKARAHRSTLIPLLGLALLGILAAPAAADERTAPGGHQLAAVASDQRTALRSEDLVSFAGRGFTKAACHPITSCQPDYPSCASWSGYTDCDDPFCGFAPQCGDDCPEIGPCPGPAMKQRRERFRVCFNAFGQSCTEWQRTMINLGCGCE